MLLLWLTGMNTEKELDTSILDTGMTNTTGLEYVPMGGWRYLWSGESYTVPDTITSESPLGEPAVFTKERSEHTVQFVENLCSAGYDVHL